MRPADHAWRADPLHERLPRNADLASRLRVLKVLQREYEIFLEYQQTVAAFDERSGGGVAVNSVAPAEA
jgi:hypothetical protein